MVLEILRRISHPVLVRMDAEIAHDIGKLALKWAPGWMLWPFTRYDERKPE